MSILTLIADDDVLARQDLRKCLAGIPEVVVIGEASSATELLAVAQVCRPDLLFVNIQMPGLTAREYAKRLLSAYDMQTPPFVISTVADANDVVIPEIEAVEYLLKPFTEETLATAVQRVKEQMSLARPDHIHELMRRDTRYATRIVLKSKGRILFLPILEIRWIRAEENYVRISTASETHLFRETMQSIEHRLDPQWFLRVHRSSIVNLRYVKEFRAESAGDLAVHLVDGIKIAMSRNYYSRIRSMLGGADLAEDRTGARLTA